MTEDQEKQAVTLLERMDSKVDEMARNMERMRLAEYIEMLENPRRLLYMNFWLGVARGFGMAIGFTILAALVLWLLQRLVILNIPVIGDFIAEIVKWVQMELNTGGPHLPRT
ncbi:MAG: DUF5665 domain-containing protein [Acidobacteriota bacterium]